MREGARVTYVGEPRDGLTHGDEGRLLALDSSDSGHVMWSTGASTGQVTLEFDYDLSIGKQASEDLLADSLDVGTLMHTSVRESYDEEGPAGLLNAMSEEGHLAAFTDIAEDALDYITARVRQDPSFRVVIAELDPEESEHLVRLAAVSLVRDAFSTED